MLGRRSKTASGARSPGAGSSGTRSSEAHAKARKGVKSGRGTPNARRRNPPPLEEQAALTLPAVEDAMGATALDRSPEPSFDDGDEPSSAETGLSVAPEDLGRQFLKTATDEASVGPVRPDAPSELPLAEAATEAVTEAMLVTALGDAELQEAPPVSRSRTEPRDVEESAEVDLHSAAIHEGSLFDQPTEHGTHSPHIEADDLAHDDSDARHTAEEEALARLRRLTRPRPIRRPPTSARSRSHR